MFSTLLVAFGLEMGVPRVSLIGVEIGSTLPGVS